MVCSPLEISLCCQQPRHRRYRSCRSSRKVILAAQGLIYGFMLFWKTFDAASIGPIRIIHIFKPRQQNYPFRRC